MYFKLTPISLLYSVLFASSIILSNANPSPQPNHWSEVHHIENRSLEKRGCNAEGPFPGRQNPGWNFICDSGRTITCSVTDASGCGSGDPSGVSSFVVTNRENNQAIGGGAGQLTVTFTCPDSGVARCDLLLRDASLGGNYGIRATY